jgi:hypothetical protein
MGTLHLNFQEMKIICQDKRSSNPDLDENGKIWRRQKMKVNEALKVIDEGWLRKPKGFRVHFQKQVDSEWVTEYSPGEKEKALDSDVVAWRLAWKLSEATKPDKTEIKEGDFINIYVVDDLGNPIKHYASNQFEVFNRREIKS